MKKESRLLIPTSLKLCASNYNFSSSQLEVFQYAGKQTKSLHGIRQIVIVTVVLLLWWWTDHVILDGVSLVTSS